MSPNPFDVKALLPAEHGQHVVLINLPIGLFIGRVAFDRFEHWTRRRLVANAAHHRTPRELDKVFLGYRLAVEILAIGIVALTGHFGRVL